MINQLISKILINMYVNKKYLKRGNILGIYFYIYFSSVDNNIWLYLIYFQCFFLTKQYPRINILLKFERAWPYKIGKFALTLYIQFRLSMCLGIEKDYFSRWF